MIQSYFGYRKQDEIWYILHKNQSFFAVFDVNMNLLRYSELFITKDFKQCEYESIDLLKWYNN